MLGRNVRVECDASPGARVLAEELSLYPRGDESRPPDIVIRYQPVESSPRARINPRAHEEYEDGFLAHFQTGDVRFHVRGADLTGIDFYIPSSSTVVSALRKALDMQFSSRTERAGMIFHELVAVPAAHWMRDLAVVHASALSDRNGDVTLIGGTGGVGKTSLMLELCLHHEYRFVADDIAFVGADGRVRPNLAYPKIYAYNLEDNPDLTRRVLAGRRPIDRLQWSVHRRRGPQFVRRRLAPDRLFGAYSSQGGALKRYFVMVREDRPNIDISELDARDAAELSVSLMPPEYPQFYNHLHWHRYHRILAASEPSITASDVHGRWTSLLGTVFEQVECYVVSVPVSMDHQRFKSEMARRLTRGDVARD